MFDTDGNQRIDKKEFLVLEEIFRKKNEKKFEHEQDEDTALLYLQLYGYRHPLIHKMLVARGGVPGPERSCWQTLRRGTNRLFFSRESEAMDDYVTVDTTLLVHFFGKKGNAELSYLDFHRFMDELQTEVLELEFLAYSVHG
ncbi:calcium uptake protein 3, mitochondrial-like [Lampetra fluviatilis]